jgi:hypothetical protein
MKTTTQAARWAARHGDDGQDWSEEHETSLQAEASATHLDNGYVRWTFPDGSTVVVVACRWDLGLDPRGTRCHCWAGANDGEHNDGCPALDVGHEYSCTLDGGDAGECDLDATTEDEAWEEAVAFALAGDWPHEDGMVGYTVVRLYRDSDRYEDGTHYPVRTERVEVSS